MKLKLLTPLVATLITTLPIQASLLVYEGFDYADGAELFEGEDSSSTPLTPTYADGVAATTGINTIETSQGWMGNPGADVESGSLSYSDGTNSVVTTGNSARMNNARGLQYTASSALGGTGTGGTMYTSFLVDPGSKDGGAGNDEWKWNFQLRNPGGRHVQLGVGDAMTGVNNTDSNLYAELGATSFNSGVALSQNTNYFILIKSTYNGTGQLTDFDLWINPSDLTSEVGSGSANISETGLALGLNGLTGFSYEKNNINNTTSAAFDEIRQGTTWDSVAPVPEPSAFALLAGLGALSLIALRRRR